MTPNIWFKIAFVIIGCLFCAFLGWYPEHLIFKAYEAKQDALALAAENTIKAKDKEHLLIVKGIQDELKIKSNLLARYYSYGLRSSSTSPVLSGQSATPGADAETRYTLLAGQCAEVTLKYELLQKYENERLGINDPQ